MIDNASLNKSSRGGDRSRSNSDAAHRPGETRLNLVAGDEKSMGQRPSRQEIRRVLPVRRDMRVAPSILRSESHHSVRLVRKIAGVAWQQEEFWPLVTSTIPLYEFRMATSLADGDIVRQCGKPYNLPVAAPQRRFSEYADSADNVDSGKSAVPPANSPESSRPCSYSRWNTRARHHCLQASSGTVARSFFKRLPADTVELSPTPSTFR